MVLLLTFGRPSRPAGTWRVAAALIVAVLVFASGSITSLAQTAQKASSATFDRVPLGSPYANVEADGKWQQLSGTASAIAVGDNDSVWALGPAANRQVLYYDKCEYARLEDDRRALCREAQPSGDCGRRRWSTVDSHRP